MLSHSQGLSINLRAHRDQVGLPSIQPILLFRSGNQLGGILLASLSETRWPEFTVTCSQQRLVATKTLTAAFPTTSLFTPLHSCCVSNPTSRVTDWDFPSTLQHLLRPNMTIHARKRQATALVQALVLSTGVVAQQVKAHPPASSFSLALCMLQMRSFHTQNACERCESQKFVGLSLGLLNYLSDPRSFVLHHVLLNRMFREGLACRDVDDRICCVASQVPKWVP